MTAQNSSLLKSKFENGDKPQGSDYTDWIDSMVSKVDATAQSITSDFTAPKIIGSTEVSSPQVNAVEVSASVGSFTRIQAGNIAISGTVSASAMQVTNLTILGSANIPVLDGPTQQGPLGQRGYLVLAQQMVVSGNATKKPIVVPPGSDILDIKLFVQTPFSTSAGSTVDILVGTSTQDTRFARFTNVSAQGWRTAANITTSAWSAVSGTENTIVAHATAVSGARASAARGVITIQYIQKQ